MRCPLCGNKGKPDSRPKASEPATFELRGRLGSKIIVRCLRCDRGVFVRVLPPGSKAISNDQWDELDSFWQMRRAEILADLQVQTQHPDGQPPGELVAQSQSSFVGTAQARSSLIHTLGRAGYRSAEDMSSLMHDRPADFARMALTARQQTVIHDRYEEILAQGGSSQTEGATARIAAARDALVRGEEGVLTFLIQTEAAPHT
jgi:hypothetical protein